MTQNSPAERDRYLATDALTPCVAWSSAAVILITLMGMFLSSLGVTIYNMYSFSVEE